MSQKSNQPIELLKSGQLLSITMGDNVGIILQKPFFAEFIGPGSAVGGIFDLQCVTIYTLGQVEFTVPETQDARKLAFERRMEDLSAMQDLCQSDGPLARSIKFIETMSDRFGEDQIRSIPDEVLAKVMGVLPSTIEMAWQSHKKLQSPADQMDYADSLAFAFAGSAR